MPPRTFEAAATDHYRMVAEVYRDALRNGAHAPSAEVARQLGVPGERARTWVRQARRRGFLGPAIGTWAGEATDDRLDAADGMEFEVEVTDCCLDGAVGEVTVRVEGGAGVVCRVSVRRAEGAVCLADLRALPLHKWSRSALAAVAHAVASGGTGPLTVEC